MATNLNNLTLDETGITDLGPLAVLPNVEVLSARNNQITSALALAGWPRVQDVNLLGNPLQSLEGVEALEVLGILDVSQTQVSDLTPLVTNETFRRGDELIIDSAALDGADCPDIAAILAREAVVTSNVQCGG
ncbi:MAG: hypothetical protein AAGB48_10805 [Planctomycetota bacterium]